MIYDKQQKSAGAVGHGAGCGSGATARTCQVVARALQQGSILVLLAASFTALPSLAAESELPAMVCHPLMLEQECRTYKADMASATTPHAKDALKAHYETLLRERERSCPCDLSHEWSKMRQSPSWLSKLLLEDNG